MKLIPTSVRPVTITLYRGIPFDNNYNEHTMFYPTAKMKYHYTDTGGSGIGHDLEDFINAKNNYNNYIYPRTTKTGTFNFAFGNGLVTSVVLELENNEINSNYMKVTTQYDGDEDDYYYFITGITQKNERTYLLNLELDVLMTYSNEIWLNLNNKPINVERKHCRRILRNYDNSYDLINTNINIKCFNQETTFYNIKSNIVKEYTPLEFKDFISHSTDFNSLMSELNWIYIIYGKSEDTPYYAHYIENGVYYPYGILCLPTKDIIFKVINASGSGANNTEVIVDTMARLSLLVGDTAVQKIIISPFPPFKECSNIKLYQSGGSYRIDVDNGIVENNYISFYTGNNSTGEFLVIHYNNINSVNHGTIQVEYGYGGKFNYTSIENYFDITLATIQDGIKTGEYKLQIAPFKDLRISSYYGGEQPIHTQYLFNKTISVGSENTWSDITFSTIVSTNAESNSYYDVSDVTEYEITAKRGISNSVAYNFPTGTDAELIYQQTAKNQYENSRLINGITAGLKIAGGVGTMLFSPSPMATIAGGFTLASGLAGEIENFTSWSAKLQDLKNTPNSYNFTGSSYAYDMAISKANNDKLLPYLITYGVTEDIERKASEFLYHYGYEYNEESYFNANLSEDTDYIFNRTLFNYVKINEDITTKIVGDNLPLTIAKKINEILNAGITLWTFYNISVIDATIIERYFHKSTYCNAEVYIDNL